MDTAEAPVAASEVQASSGPVQAAPAPRLVAAQLYRFEPAAALLGATLLAVVNAVFITRLSKPAGGLGLRLEHHAYDAAMLLFAGLLIDAGSEAWQLWGPRGRRWSLLVISALSILVGFFTLSDDLSGFAIDTAGDWSGALLAVLVVIGSLAVPVSVWLGSRLARPGWRWAGAGAGALLAIGNHLILPKGYPGIHLYFAVVGATLFGVSLSGASALRALDALGLRARRLLLGGRFVLAFLAAASVVVLPRQAALIELYRLDGQVVAPIVGEIHAELEGSDEIAEGDAGVWFENRSNKPAIPASKQFLLPKDGIVILITIDSVLAEVIRNDANREKLPVLFGLRDGAVYFTEARAPASGTTTTISSLLADKYVSQLTWSRAPGIKRATPYKDQSLRLPEALQQGQVKSVHFLSYPPLAAKSGIGRGFSEEQALKPREGQRFALSDAAIPAMIKRLEKQRKGRLFLFAHLMDPHHPHDTGSQEGTLFDRYVSEIAVVDRQLGELQNAIRRLDLEDRTVLIVTADHGEGFGKHETPHHNVNLYEELIHVPLLMQAPKLPAHRITQPVTLLDLPPTILDFFGLPTPGSYMGQSLAPLLRGNDTKLTRPIAAEIPNKQAMFFGRAKVIRDRKMGTMELYDLDRDPEELDNQFDESGPGGREKAALLNKFFKAHRTKAGAPSEPLD